MSMIVSNPRSSLSSVGDIEVSFVPPAASSVTAGAGAAGATLAVIVATGEIGWVVGCVPQADKIIAVKYMNSHGKFCILISLGVF
jgi:hypothetical protein